MNKQMLGFWERYRHAPQYTIYNAYRKPSSAKISAYYKCIRFMKSVGGYMSAVVSYNTFMFTFGFMTDDGFYYITPSHTYYCTREELPQ